MKEQIIQKIIELEEKLDEAIEKKDFLTADKLNTEIENLQKNLDNSTMGNWPSWSRDLNRIANQLNHEELINLSKKLNAPPYLRETNRYRNF